MKAPYETGNARARDETLEEQGVGLDVEDVANIMVEYTLGFVMKDMIGEKKREESLAVGNTFNDTTVQLNGNLSHGRRYKVKENVGKEMEEMGGPLMTLILRMFLYTTGIMRP